MSTTHSLSISKGRPSSVGSTSMAVAKRYDGPVSQSRTSLSGGNTLNHRLTATKQLLYAEELNNEEMKHVTAMLPPSNFNRWLGDDDRTHFQIDHTCVPRDEGDVPAGSKSAVKDPQLPLSERLEIMENALNCVEDIKYHKAHENDVGVDILRSIEDNDGEYDVLPEAVRESQLAIGQQEYAPQQEETPVVHEVHVSERREY